MAKTLVYEMWPISWPGGLKQMQKHLDVLEQLHVDYVWVAPLYPSPRYDHGYDIADYEAIDSRFGTMADFDNFVKAAHDKGIGVLMDLVLNHTSIYHPWFIKNPWYYYRATEDQLEHYADWHNLFDGGPAWEKDTLHGYPYSYYLHLFTKEQADLDWFPPRSELKNGMENGILPQINYELVREFQYIVNFWLTKHAVDGFRLDVPQALNKDFSLEKLTFESLLVGCNQDARVINAIFDGSGAPKTRSGEKPFLMVECFDPTNGEIIQNLRNEAPIDFVLNVTLKDQIDQDYAAFDKSLHELLKIPGFMLDLESHDSPRFPSRSDLEPAEIMDILFQPTSNAVCLYQGQELGLRNPNKQELPNWLMLDLDAQTRMQHTAGTSLDQLRPKSRANAREPFPTHLYSSTHARELLNSRATLIANWKKPK